MYLHGKKDKRKIKERNEGFVMVLKYIYRNVYRVSKKESSKNLKLVLLFKGGSRIMLIENYMYVKIC